MSLLLLLRGGLFLRPPSDDLEALTDDVALAQLKSLPDEALGLSDTLALFLTPLVEDVEGLSDVLALTRGVVLADEALGLSDSLTVVRQQSMDDSLGLSDTVAVDMLVRTVTITDALGLRDAIPGQKPRTTTKRRYVNDPFPTQWLPERVKPLVTPHSNTAVGKGQWLYRNATSNRVGRPPLAPRKETP